MSKPVVILVSVIVAAIGGGVIGLGVFYGLKCEQDAKEIEDPTWIITRDDKLMTDGTSQIIQVSCAKCEEKPNVTCSLVSKDGNHRMPLTEKTRKSNGDNATVFCPIVFNIHINFNFYSARKWSQGNVECYFPRKNNVPQTLLLPPVMWSPNSTLQVSDSNVMDNSTLNFSVNSYGGFPTPTHSCIVKDDQDKEITHSLVSYKEIAHTHEMNSTISNFELWASREHRLISIICTVTQNGTAFVDVLSKIVHVIYPPTLLIQETVSVWQAGDPVVFKLVIGRDTNPQPTGNRCVVLCDGREMAVAAGDSKDKQPQTHLMSFTPVAGWQDCHILCSVWSKQGETVMHNTSVSSSALRTVFYESHTILTSHNTHMNRNFSWLANQTVNISMTSTSGYPNTEHDSCRIGDTLLTKISEDVINSTITSTYSAESGLWMDGQTIYCLKSQGNYTYFRRNITQTINILHEAATEKPEKFEISPASLNFALKAALASPRPFINCSFVWSEASNSAVQPEKTEQVGDFLLFHFKFPLASLPSGVDHVNISCWLHQADVFALRLVYQRYLFLGNVSRLANTSDCPVACETVTSAEATSTTSREGGLAESQSQKLLGLIAIPACVIMALVVIGLVLWMRHRRSNLAHTEAPSNCYIADPASEEISGEYLEAGWPEDNKGYYHDSGLYENVSYPRYDH